MFLDFDGTTHPFIESALENDIEIAVESLFCWRPLLETALAEYPAVRIVVSSDWRHFCDDLKLREHLGPLAPRLAGVTGLSPGHSRADYVLQVVKQHALQHWCALDDDPSVRDAASDEPNFIWCNPEHGLAAQHVQVALVSWLAHHGKPSAPRGARIRK